MKIPANLIGEQSPPLLIFATEADLPKPDNFQGRQVIIRDTGQTVLALDGAWRDSTGAPI